MALPRLVNRARLGDAAARQCLQEADEETGVTVLMAAAASCPVRSVRELTQLLGALGMEDVLERKDRQGTTAAEWADRFGQAEVAVALRGSV